jgi:uncharacterized integral membrane protein
MATEPRRSQGRLYVRLAGGLIALVLFIIFAVENGRTVRVRFFFWELNTSLAWALVVAALLGLVLGLLVPRIRRVLSALKSD